MALLWFKRRDENSIKTIKEVKTYDYGKFGTFEDPFGNIIEL